MQRSLLLPRVKSDEGVGGTVALEKLGGGRNRRPAVGAQTAMIAVVKDDVAGVAAALIAVYLVHQACCDFVGGGLAPVRSRGVPCNRNQIELLRKFEYVWTPRPKRRAEETHRLAGDLGEDVIGPSKFFKNPGV